jgi:serine/threonine protein kinase
MHFLVMEHLEGETLADRLVKGPLPTEQVLKHGVEICEGLHSARKKGVIHRDLKPGNIMLTKTGAKLMDFGLAKATPSRAAAASSLTITISGPPEGRPLTVPSTEDRALGALHASTWMKLAHRGCLQQLFIYRS